MSAFVRFFCGGLGLLDLQLITNQIHLFCLGFFSTISLHLVSKVDIFVLFTILMVPVEE